MPTLDATAKAQLELQVVKPAFLVYLDILGDPIRATTAGYTITLGALSDADLSGHTFNGVDPRFVTIGDVKNQESGSETLACELSGLILPDAALLTTIGDRANWQGRTARLWVMIRNEAGVQQGAIAAYYTGYMSSLEIVPSPETQVIRLEIENYKMLLSQPSNRTYLDQSAFDAADTSAAATIGAALGARTGAGAALGVYESPTDRNSRSGRFMEGQ